MIFVMGLCFGSFVNMLMYRTAVEYELIKSKGIKKINSISFLKMLGGRSFCDSCGKQLYWYENIPVMSWLIQKGKTRCCDKKLPVLYPIVEMMTGLLFLIFLITNYELLITNYVELIIGLVIITFLVFSAVFDLKYMILPDFSTILLAASAMVLWITGHLGDLSYLWSGLISFVFLVFLYLITKKKGMGFGDVKLAFFMGLFLGYPKIIVAMYLAFVLGALFGVVLIVFKKAKKKTKISFGPFLILGTLIAWFWGEQILSLSVFQFIR